MVDKMGVLADNTVLTNFALIRREEMLRDVFSGGIFTTEAVLKELYKGEKRGVLPRRNWSFLKILKIESEYEQRLFERLNRRLGEGESSCLSLAVHRGIYKILTDDLDTRRYAQRIGIPVSGTIGVLVDAIRKGIISKEKGNAFLSEMIKKGYYSPYRNLDELAVEE